MRQHACAHPHAPSAIHLNVFLSPPPPPPPSFPLQFPYPILNNLPFPLGFASFVLLGFVVVLFAFQLGKAVKTLLGGGSSSGSGKSSAPRRRRSSGGGEKPKDQ